jgi:hypothetical protein
VNILEHIDRFIFESKLSKLISWLILASFVKVGIWHIPNIYASYAIAQNPFINPFSDPEAHYLLWSWLGPFLAWCLAINSEALFFIFHLFF